MTEKAMGKAYLEPEEEIIKDAKKTTQESKNAEKHILCIKYEADEKTVLLSEIKRLKCEILEQSDSKNYVKVRVSMSQFAAIKSLNCIENVEFVDASLMIKGTTDLFDVDIDIAEASRFTEHVSLL